MHLFLLSRLRTERLDRQWAKKEILIGLGDFLQATLNGLVGLRVYAFPSTENDIISGLLIRTDVLPESLGRGEIRLQQLDLFLDACTCKLKLTPMSGDALALND